MLCYVTPIKPQKCVNYPKMFTKMPKVGQNISENVVYGLSFELYGRLGDPAVQETRR